MAYGFMGVGTEPYTFRRITPADLQIVNGWLETSAVREWWVDEDGQPSDPFDEEDLARSDVAMWIVSLAGKPFAFIQDYDPHAWPEHHFSHLPAGSRGIDQFVGEPDMLGRGHGTAFIRAHIDRLMLDGAPAVGTDPHPDNARAIRVYEKAGFVRGEERATAWGRCLLMEVSAN